jgi:hypothetical protein
METRKKVRVTIILVVLFFAGLVTGLYAQEATETPSETAITEETTTTTPTTPRIVSQELLTELKARQADVEDAQRLVNYVVSKIVAEYQVDIRTELINIETGEITPRPAQVE